MMQIIIVILASLSTAATWGDPDRIIFPGPTRDRRMSTHSPIRSSHPAPSSSCRHSQCSNRQATTTTLPMSLVRELNEVSDLQNITHLIANSDEFLMSLQDGDGPGVQLKSRLGSDDTSSTSTYTKMPACIPQPTLIPLTTDDLETNNFLIPSCVRVDRCSGCCYDHAMECAAVNGEKQSFKISVFQLDYSLTSKSKIKFTRFKTFVMEKHTKCKCECKIKPKDCNLKQIYRPELCYCECGNRKEREACERHYDRYWNESTCTCGCIESSDCTTGTYFDTSLCECVLEDS